MEILSKSCIAQGKLQQLVYISIGASDYIWMEQMKANEDTTVYPDWIEVSWWSWVLHMNLFKAELHATVHPYNGPPIQKSSDWELTFTAIASGEILTVSAWALLAII